MRRVWTSLLFVLTAVVAVGVGYVVIHQDAVPRAGQTPGVPPVRATSTPAADTTSDGGTTGTPSGTASDTANGTTSSGGDAQRTLRVTFLGDDWVDGVGASDSATPWTRRVASQLGVDATAIGVDGGGYAKPAGGTTYAGLIDRAVRSHPNVVVVIGGRNDVGDDGATLRQGATTFFAELHRRMPRVDLFAVAPFWGDSPHPDKLTPVDTAVRSGIEAVGGTYLQVADPLEGHASWMADDAHPNDKGYRAIADAVATALRAHLSN